MAVNIIGNKYGRLTVLERMENQVNIRHNYKEDSWRKEIKAMWLCLCECGNTKVIQGNSLRGGRTRSCGCLHKEVMNEVNRRKKK